MAQKTKIEWTEYTWNPVTGCTKISAGCTNCYAERMAIRLKSMGVKRYRNGFKVTLHPDLIDKPLNWSTPRVVFINSMSDLFHEQVPLEFIERVFSVMNQCPQHTFQVLTKRSERLLELSDRLKWSHNIWTGVTVENSDCAYRIDNLAQVPARTRFVSFEPLIGPVSDIEFTKIDWVIVGGESGPYARTMKKEWVTEIRDLCISNGIPYFFKQWGGKRKKRNGRILDGKTWDEMPVLSHKNKIAHPT
jgi:protein gp37